MLKQYGLSIAFNRSTVHLQLKNKKIRGEKPAQLI